MSDYINELNDSQRAAVLYNDGPSLVIAGAGSGKTRVLTYKIAYLLEQGYRPWNILALTFTNKAAREMKERIARQVGQESASKLWMGTFHSMFLRILRTEADILGFPRDFTVYDTADQKSLIRTLLKTGMGTITHLQRQEPLGDTCRLRQQPRSLRSRPGCPRPRRARCLQEVLGPLPPIGCHGLR